MPSARSTTQTRMLAHANSSLPPSHPGMNGLSQRFMRTVRQWVSNRRRSDLLQRPTGHEKQQPQKALSLADRGYFIVVQPNSWSNGSGCQFALAVVETPSVRSVASSEDSTAECSSDTEECLRLASSSSDASLVAASMAASSLPVACQEGPSGDVMSECQQQALAPQAEALQEPMPAAVLA